MSQNENVKTLYILGTDWTAAGASPEDALLLKDDDRWVVFNAPRGIYGRLQWNGEFRHGIFYAAVDLDMAAAQDAIQFNKDMDGWLVKLITEDQVRGKLLVHAMTLASEHASPGYSSEMILADVMGEYADHYLDQLGLPRLP